MTNTPTNPSTEINVTGGQIGVLGDHNVVSGGIHFSPAPTPAAEARGKCVAAINACRQDHRVPLAVCSRTADYEALTDRIFLRRVGGGYIFVHRLLMEHFAAM